MERAGVATVGSCTPRRSRPRTATCGLAFGTFHPAEVSLRDAGGQMTVTPARVPGKRLSQTNVMSTFKGGTTDRGSNELGRWTLADQVHVDLPQPLGGGREHSPPTNAGGMCDVGIGSAQLGVVKVPNTRFEALPRFRPELPTPAPIRSAASRMVLANRRHSLRWLESITHHSSTRQVLTSSDAGLVDGVRAGPAASQPQALPRAPRATGRHDPPVKLRRAITSAVRTDRRSSGGLWPFTVDRARRRPIRGPSSGAAGICPGQRELGAALSNRRHGHRSREMYQDHT